VGELVVEVLKHWPGSCEDQSDPHAHHEAKLLQLSTDKAHALLGWSPAWRFADAVRETITWYRQTQLCSDPARFESLMRGQIENYTAAAAGAGIPWAQQPFA